MAKTLEEYGKDSVWCCQTGSVNLDGAHTETLEAMQFLGDWFKKKTGKMLVITSVVDGSSHQSGEHSHSAGWKFDCNDFGGPEGLNQDYFGPGLDKQPLCQEFAKAGAEKGLGMNIECPNTENVHWDISAWGQQWTGPFSPGSMGGWNNCAGSGRTAGTIWNAPGGSATAAGNNSNSAKTEDCGSKVILKPYKKTFCEPMYPDLQVLPGNIPTSLIEQITSESNGSQDVGTTANPYKVMSSQGMSDATGLDLGGFTTDSAQIQRQKTYNVKDNINDRKISGGKPLNNNDRYPVDLKAEELLIHEPKIKQNEISQGTSGLRNVIDSVLIGLDHAEKRVVKLENVLATVMRYVFGMAGRMQINCVYYGGQDHRAKYKCIRCMRDDRVNDGQVMQIDQCLSCTRYEPIFGQTYDILNEIGANTAMVLDDTQMAYMNLRDYAKFSRIEESPEPKQDVSFDTSENSTRSSLAVKFKDEWDQGVKMKWKLTPKENQKPIINWRQDINKPDKSPKKLPSFQFNAANAGSQTGGASVASDACPVLPGDKMTIMAAHYNYMKEDGHKIEEVAKFYDEANDWAMEKGGHGRSALSSINTQKYADTLNKLAKEKNVDPLLMLAIFTVESGAIQGKDGGGIAQLSVLKDKKTLTPEEDIGTAIDAIKGYLDKYSAGGNPMLAVTLFGAGAGDSKFLAKKSKENQLFDKDWISTLKMEFDDKDEIYAYWPRVVCSYIFFANSDTKKSVLAQGDAPSEYDFLFKDSDLDKVNFVKDYGGTNEGKGNSSMSQSITFQISKPDEVEVITSKIGAITKSGKDELGEYIRIKYDDNAEIEYHGLASVDKEIQKGANNPGQDSSSVKEKQVIGKAGKVITVIYYSNGKPEDPKLIWPSLRGKESNDKENGTLGAIVKQGQSDSQSVTSKDSVVVGGNTDGTYDMDDLANYDFSTSSDDSDSSSDSNNETDSNNDNNNDAGKDFDPNNIPDMTLSGKSLKDIITEANTITDEDEIKAVDKQKDKALEILKGTYEQSVNTLKENYEKEKKEIQDKKLDTDKEKEELKSAEEKYNKSLDEIEKTYKDMKSSINTYYSDKKTSLENKKKEEDNKKDNQGDKDNPEEKLDYDALNKEFEEFRSKRYSQWLTDNGLTSNSTYDFDDERYASEGLNNNKDFHQGVYCKQDNNLENYVDDMMKKIVKARQQQLEEQKKEQEKEQTNKS